MVLAYSYLNTVDYQDSSDFKKAKELLTHWMGVDASLTSQGYTLVELLSHLKVDIETQVAGFLLPAAEKGVIDYRVTTRKLGLVITRLLQGSEHFLALNHYLYNKKSPEQVEKFRKMLLAIVEDPRVVLIGLANHLCLLRQAKNDTESVHQQLGQETLDIFAPLANRLGIWQLKWELEDFALRYLNPKAYKDLAGKLKARRSDREQYVAQVIGQIEQTLAQANIQGKVSGRPKHLYSIWKKMQAKHLDFEQLFDIHAFRIIVQDTKSCYAALSLVHNLWTPITEEFDDYIARPKANGYRSLHTAVRDHLGKSVEIQIRSLEMHQESELGVASHWRYKEGSKSDSSFEQRIIWLRSFLEKKEEGEENLNHHVLDQLKTKVFDYRVYVFTPTGQVIDLPEGSTPLDFAYTIHTEVGHRCRGAKINGVIAPLTQKLISGQQIEILTARESTPSRDWLNPKLGYLYTTQARAKIQHWFKLQDQPIYIDQGRVLLEQTRHRNKLNEVDLKPLLKKFHHQSEDNLLAAIGYGDISINQLNTAIKEQITKVELIKSSPSRSSMPYKKSLDQYSIQATGISDISARRAGCCQPIVKDSIIGYITKNNGVAAHRTNCINIIKLSLERQKRLIDVSWVQRKK
ncbi:RelA/SpoT family protein [Candidatus Nitrosacidococcus sp. I8]|uniref:RelA/SpoT family protein n=1 Tax=Candidatus Nitrosacidococcus sp. I8 TaxID=2942908 RepID=UPI0022280B27|nr:RelA/SpoT family protein [Candidatus Nitrosacidococcus sp. I8]CAH9017796.1 GTP pyrophosphokinase [Candidatus Nitrosacidococcus sp. I8]